MNLEQARAERQARRDKKRRLRANLSEFNRFLNSAYTHHQANEFSSAITYYEQALAIDSDQPVVRNNFGIALKEVERWDDAIAQYELAIEMDPKYAAAYNNLGNALNQVGRQQEAVKAYRGAVSLHPENASVLSNFGIALQDVGDYEEAEQVFSTILKMNPNFGSAYSNLATAQHSMGRTDQALENFKKRFVLERGDNPLLPEHKSFLTTSKSKIDHDIEQYRYLATLNYSEPDFSELATLYETLRDETEWPTGEEPLVKLTPDQLQRVGHVYNRAVYVSQAPKLDGPAINPDLDAEAITKAYYQGLDGCKEVAAVDNLLSDEALKSLRSFLLESTIWYDVYRRGYLGAYFGEGLECGLLLQIAEELSQKFPDIMKNYKLNQVWSNKYDSQLTGIGLHADYAAVNINFWITPDSANLNQENGGLVVYGHEAPRDWNFESYNRDEEKIRTFLDTHNSEHTVIPYRENRMAIFNSDLFHETDTIDFKPGYENRRINVTMLFGTRQSA